MGMFDSLTCEYPLPEHKEFQERKFQTKSLGSTLECFEITSQGELLKLQLNEGEVIKSHWPHFGEVRLYDTVDNEGEYLYSGEPFNRGWIEYCALFKDGWLKEIKLTKYEEPKKVNKMEHNHSHTKEEPAWITEVDFLDCPEPEIEFVKKEDLTDEDHHWQNQGLTAVLINGVKCFLTEPPDVPEE